MDVVARTERIRGDVGHVVRHPLAEDAVEQEREIEVLVGETVAHRHREARLFAADHLAVFGVDDAVAVDILQFGGSGRGSGLVGHLLAVLVDERELVAFLPDADHVPVVVDRQRLADEPLVVDVVSAVAAQRDDLVAVEREGEVGLPPEILLADILRMERQFDTLVAGLADVVENLAVTVHNGNGTRHQQVVRVGEVHVDRTAQTAVEELEVDTEVGRIGGLPTQVGIADTVARQVGRVGGVAVVAPNIFDTIGRVETVERLIT